MLIAIIIWLISSIIWGFATQTIVENKGYYENWFWWGFFFGIIAVLVALSKPQSHAYDAGNVDRLTYVADTYMIERNGQQDSKVVTSGKWKCHFCNRINESYTGTCVCGRSKSDTENFAKQREEEQMQQSRKATEGDAMDKLKKLKELLDMGALTQEEFDLKKKELLAKKW